MLLLLATALAATVPPDAGSEVRALAKRLIEEVGPRPARSDGAELAQRFVESELALRGWTPERVAGGVPEGNVVACRPGDAAEAVLLLAHTDSVHGDVAGANDNAVAVAALLVAAELIPERPKRTVCLGFPGGEELGLLGSAAMAATWDQPLDQVVALDLVGRGTPTHNGLGPQWTDAQLRELFRVAPADVPWVYRGLSFAMPHMERSDHGPYTVRGIPASHWMARAEGGVYPPYHTVDDTLEWVEDEALQATVEAMVALGSAPLLPRDGHAGPHAVLPGTNVLLPGAAVWQLALVGAVLAMVGFRARKDESAGWRDYAAGLGSWLAGGVVGLVAWLIVLGQAPTLTQLGGGAALLWAGAAVGMSFGPVTPILVSRRMMGTVLLVVGGLVLYGAGPLLTLPVFAGGLAVTAWSTRSVPFRVVATVAALWPAGFFVRAGPMMELAFHHMVPASPWFWGPFSAVLLLPLLPWFATEEHRVWGRRIALGALLIAAVYAGLAPAQTDAFPGRTQLWWQALD